MFRRTYLGLEINQFELRAVALMRQGKSSALLGEKTKSLAATVLKPSIKSLNIIQPEEFVAAVKELLIPLAKKETRIAVALPDLCGQLFLLDVETPLENRNEGAEIVRWCLKDILPNTLNDAALDYQILQENESGHKRILAALIPQQILRQYEELLDQAGYAATVVDFHSLALYNAYRTKIDLNDDFILIGVDNEQLSIMIFHNKTLAFCRLRRVTQDPHHIFQEINRSLVTYRNEHQTFSHLAVHLHSDWQNREELYTAVNAVFDQEVQWLQSPINRVPNQPNHNKCSSIAAAFGVAERMIQRVAS